MGADLDLDLCQSRKAKKIEKKQCCASALVSIRIQIQSQHFKSMRIWIRYQVQGFDDHNFTQFYSWRKKVNIFFQKIAIYPIYSKNVEATGQASSPQKEDTQHFKAIDYFIFSLSVCLCFPTGLYPGIRLIKIHSDPDSRNINYLGASDS